MDFSTFSLQSAIAVAVGALTALVLFFAFRNKSNPDEIKVTSDIQHKIKKKKKDKSEEIKKEIVSENFRLLKLGNSGKEISSFVISCDYIILVSEEKSGYSLRISPIYSIYSSPKSLRVQVNAGVVTCISALPGGNIIACCIGTGERINIYKIEKHQESKDNEQEQSEKQSGIKCDLIHSLELKSSERHKGRMDYLNLRATCIVTGSRDDKCIKLWSLGGQLLSTHQLNQGKINSLSISNDGLLGLAGCEINEVKVLRVEYKSASQVRSEIEHEREKESDINNPRNKNKEQLRIKQAASQPISLSHVSSLFGHKKQILCVCFSPDGSLAYTACEDGFLRVWRVRIEFQKKQPEIIAQFPLNPQYLQSLGFDRKQNENERYSKDNKGQNNNKSQGSGNQNSGANQKGNKKKSKQRESNQSNESTSNKQDQQQLLLLSQQQIPTFVPVFEGSVTNDGEYLLLSNGALVVIHFLGENIGKSDGNKINENERNRKIQPGIQLNSLII